MFNFIMGAKSKLGNRFKQGFESRITDEQFIALEIHRFKISPKRKAMFDGERYYEGKHDILFRKRMVIGQNGELEEVKNLPNNKIVDNQYNKMVDQKNNYLLGQPISVQSDNEQYSKLLKKVFNKKFQRIIRNLGEDILNYGIGWLYLHYDEQGELAFKRFKPYEIIPGWKDEEHTVLDYAIRLYEVITYEGKIEKIVEKVEVYDNKGISYFELNNGDLKPCEPYHHNYFTEVDEEGNEQAYNWSKIPLIPFKYNNKEIPLIKKLKTLQDGINTILSNFQNQMEEDPRNTILVLVNYDGENLGEFRKNLAQYGAVKVRTVDGSGGDLRTLQVEVNSDNYKVILEEFKKAIIENAKGYDAKDDRMSGNPNQMNIQSMYSDIDLDANAMETEFQASFEELLWFINSHLFNSGLGDFTDEDVEIVFNKDILINESEVIENCQKSYGILSDKTIVKNHPWVDDVQSELDVIEEQKEANMLNEYNDVFNSDIGGDGNEKS